MKSKQFARSGAFLIELILSVAFLAVCGCVCLSVFVKADTVSRESLDKTHAINVAQSAAEQFKAAPLDWERQGTVTRRYTQDWAETDSAQAECFVVSIAVSRQVENRDMLAADICVMRTGNSDAPVFELTIKKYLPVGGASS